MPSNTKEPLINYLRCRRAVKNGLKMLIYGVVNCAFSTIFAYRRLPRKH